MVKRIPLSGNKGKITYALFDDADYEKIKDYSWWNSRNYAKTELWNGGNRVSIYMHRLIADTPDGMVCDHINGNKLDNRRRNLRNTYQRLNSRNRKGQGHTSQYKGVFKENRSGRWIARIMLDNVWIHIGAFRCETKAASAYNDKAIELFGEYARLNDLTGETNQKLSTIRRYTDGDIPTVKTIPFPSDTLPHLRPTVRRIRLSGPNGKGKCVLVDAEDHDYLIQFTWNYLRGYARLANSTRLVKSGVVSYSYMHQILLPAPDGYVVDHINQNKLDNRKSNLRLATHAGNMRNTSVKSNKATKSVFKGVFKQGNGWQASISVNSQQMYLGFYGTQREAAQAYNDAALEYHGEFAHINDLSIIKPENDPDIRTPQKSQYTGVSFHKKQQKWCAYVCYKKQQKSLGSYDTELEAAKVRDSYVKEHALPLKLNLA